MERPQYNGLNSIKNSNYISQLNEIVLTFCKNWVDVFFLIKRNEGRNVPSNAGNKFHKIELFAASLTHRNMAENYSKSYYIKSDSIIMRRI